jgi:DNA polymerase
MNDYNIRDLELAGVKWELADVPFVLRAKWNGAQNTQTQTTTTPNVNASLQHVTVVPPISPIETVSVDTAISMASRPTDLDNLIRMIGEFNHPLRSVATKTVFPNIATNPNGLVVITDVPGADDDASGQILSGGAGELFDKMLSAIGMSRDNVSIVPIIFWRTPGGRTPTADELSLTRPFLNRILEFLSPKTILTLGATPAMEIAGIQLSHAHGRITVTENGTQIMSIYHPNYLMLKPSAKRDAWTALQELQKLLKNQ